jgi:hypothetical protein
MKRCQEALSVYSTLVYEHEGLPSGSSEEGLGERAAFGLAPEETE